MKNIFWIYVTLAMCHVYETRAHFTSSGNLSNDLLPNYDSVAEYKALSVPEQKQFEDYLSTFTDHERGTSKSAKQRTAKRTKNLKEMAEKIKEQIPQELRKTFGLIMLQSDLSRVPIQELAIKANNMTGAQVSEMIFILERDNIVCIFEDGLILGFATFALKSANAIEITCIVSRENEMHRKMILQQTLEKANSHYSQNDQYSAMYRLKDERFHFPDEIASIIQLGFNAKITAHEIDKSASFINTLSNFVFDIENDNPQISLYATKESLSSGFKFEAKFLDIVCQRLSLMHRAHEFERRVNNSLRNMVNIHVKRLRMCHQNWALMTEGALNRIAPVNANETDFDPVAYAKTFENEISECQSVIADGVSILDSLVLLEKSDKSDQELLWSFGDGVFSTKRRPMIEGNLQKYTGYGKFLLTNRMASRNEQKMDPEMLLEQFLELKKVDEKLIEISIEFGDATVFTTRYLINRSLQLASMRYEWADDVQIAIRFKFAKVHGFKKIFAMLYELGFREHAIFSNSMNTIESRVDPLTFVHEMPLHSDKDKFSSLCLYALKSSVVEEKQDPNIPKSFPIIDGIQTCERFVDVMAHKLHAFMFHRNLSLRVRNDPEMQIWLSEIASALTDCDKDMHETLSKSKKGPESDGNCPMAPMKYYKYPISIYRQLITLMEGIEEQLNARTQKRK